MGISPSTCHTCISTLIYSWVSLSVVDRRRGCFLPPRSTSNLFLPRKQYRAFHATLLITSQLVPSYYPAIT